MLLVVVTACGGADSANDGAPGAAADEPPALYVFTEAEKQEMGYDPDTEVFVYVDTYENYATIDEMIAGSDIIVRGVVDGWGEGRIVGGGEVSSEIITIAVSVIDVVAGDVQVGEVVSFLWTAWELNPDGTRGRMWLSNGIRVPVVGQELVLFLREWPEDQGRSLAVRPTHYVATMDGILNVVGERLSSELYDGSGGEGVPRVGVQLNQVTLNDLRYMVDATNQ
jgi:hypothetical protein